MDFHFLQFDAVAGPCGGKGQLGGVEADSAILGIKTVLDPQQPLVRVDA